VCLLAVQVELLRVLKEKHLASLKLEVETSHRDDLREAIADAIAGNGLPGSDKLRKLSQHQLQVRGKTE